MCDRGFWSVGSCREFRSSYQTALRINFIRMKGLHVEVFSDVFEDVCSVPIETVMTLLTYEYCGRPPAKIILVSTTKTKTRHAFDVKTNKLNVDLLKKSEVKAPANFCKLPVVVEGATCVAGLCAVLRHVLKISDVKHPLLGFKQSCLYACAESSIWTKFCEIDIVETVNDLFSKTNWPSSDVEIPIDVARFEVHMSQPVRIHNIQKQKQDYARANGAVARSGLPDSRLAMLPELDHVYAEGPELTLADIMILPCLHIILQFLGSVFLKQHLPLAYKWYENMLVEEKVNSAIKSLLNLERKFIDEIYVNYVFPGVPNQSLYKSETKRSKPRHQGFTKQEDIDIGLEIIKEMGISADWENSTFGRDVDFDWTSVPFEAQPEGGQLPEKRLERKGQQLENMTKAVLKIAKQCDQIVDFCSGSGHLGLILAHSLPRCTIILLENKEESLSRARLRANKLKLSNIVFCQSNIDYFCGAFNIGVSLHACGVATDLVMERCLQQRAAFVCCPCCYGSIQPNHMIVYPRSHVFRTSKLSLKEYLVLGHSSDQTHDQENVKTSQGNKCMGIIDTDRCLRAKELGYFVSLSKLEPPSCTPKNNLLVGIPLC